VVKFSAKVMALPRKFVLETWFGYHQVDNTDMVPQWPRPWPHIDIQEQLDDKTVDGMEKVSDEQYKKSYQDNKQYD
jgi:hypothetical protein